MTPDIYSDHYSDPKDSGRQLLDQEEVLEQVWDSLWGRDSELGNLRRAADSVLAPESV